MREMWQVYEKVKLPPAAPDASIVDYRRRIADEIPQKFRSQELKVEPFCIETFQQQEELPSYGFGNELQASNSSTKLHNEYASVAENDDVFSRSLLTNSNRLDFVEQIPEDIEPRLKVEQPFEKNYSQSFEDYDSRWNILNWDYWGEAGSQIINPKPVQSFSYIENTYPDQEEIPFDVQQGTSATNFRTFDGEEPQERCSANNFELATMSNGMQTFPEMTTSSQGRSLPEVISKDNQAVPNIQSNPGLILNETCSISNPSVTNSILNYSSDTLTAENSHIVPMASSNSIYQIQGSSRVLQEYPNFYQTPAGNQTNISAIVGGERRISQSSKDNPPIKFHIRTITHCEVECPAPSSNLPISNQAVPFLQPGGQPIHSGSQNHRQLQEICDAGMGRAICAPPWDNFQTNDNTLKSNKNFSPQIMQEIEVSQSNQILPFQPSSTHYTNPFQNGAGK